MALRSVSVHLGRPKGFIGVEADLCPPHIALINRRIMLRSPCLLTTNRGLDLGLVRRQDWAKCRGTNENTVAYLAMIPEAKRADFMADRDAMPIWATSTWAFGVWGAVARSLLILLRSRHAVAAFTVALLGLIATKSYTYFSAPTSPMSRPDSATFILTAAIFLIIIGALYSSRRQVAAGNLR